MLLRVFLLLLPLFAASACADDSSPADASSNPAGEPVRITAPASDRPGISLPPLPEGFRDLADDTAPYSPGPYLMPVGWEDMPPLPFEDDPSALISAIDNQLEYLANFGAPEIAFGGGRRGEIPRSRVMATLLRLREIVGDYWGTDDFDSALAENFIAYTSTGEGDGRVNFTGYFAPLLAASSRRSDTYPWPLYSRPPRSARRRGRFPTHEEIDNGALDGRGLEIAYVSDRIERFFLMVQGSGMIEYPDGTIRSARYAGGNGRAYRSIGRLLVEDGKIPANEISMQRIHRYFNDHPDDIDRYLYRCESFVFFSVDDTPPLGVGRIPLTPNESIATDNEVFGTGLVGFIDYMRPYAAPDTGPAPTRRAVHFALAQDVGGAIDDADHVDIFCGSGEEAEIAAGFLNHPGRLYLIVARP